MTTNTEPAYLESFGCLLATDDEGCVHEGECDQDWHCATCRRRLDGQPCPDHAPVVFPGLELVECYAQPRHWLWAYKNDAYGTGCTACQIDSEMDAHRGCAHSQHRAWRRLGLLRWLAGHGYAAGFIRSTGESYGGGCNGCLTFRWGRSSYVLWKSRDWWGCLLRRRHLFRESPLDGMCERCYPLPDDDWFATGSNR